MREEQPLVWMNVTTSANWNRPAVGIVRVEQALCEELARLYGDRFRRCVWLDGEFVEFRPGQNHNNPEFAAALDQLLPPAQTFDLARKFLAGRLAQFSKRSRRTGEQSLLAEIPVKNLARRKPTPDTTSAARRECMLDLACAQQDGRVFSCTARTLASRRDAIPR